MRFTMAVYRDADRLRPVLDDPLEAEGIIVDLLGVQPDMIQDGGTARDEYLVDLPDALVLEEPSVIHAGVLDVARPGHGRITALLPERETENE